MANNPVPVSCTADTWTKVATSVKSGMIHKLTKIDTKYLQTFRLTGEAAPTLKSEGVVVFENSSSATISSTVDIDVYIYSIGVTSTIRVDV